jgi:hypothetical protein
MPVNPLLYVGSLQQSRKEGDFTIPNGRITEPLQNRRALPIINWKRFPIRVA